MANEGNCLTLSWSRVQQEEILTFQTWIEGSLVLPSCGQGAKLA